MEVCLFGGAQGPSGELFMGQGWAVKPFSMELELCFIPEGYHLVLASFSLLYSWRHQQFAPTAVPVWESPPRSLPWCSDGAGAEQTLGNEGVYCYLQLILKSCPQVNESSYLLLAGCDSGFYHDCFCEVAG